MIESHKIHITSVKYMSKQEIDNSLLNHPHSRVMDGLSRQALLIAAKIFNEKLLQRVNPEMSGVVIASDSGPCEALNEHVEILLRKGFKGINPSKFPNTMLSTVLSRVTTEFNLKGPSTVLYSDFNRRHAVEYAAAQIKKRRCDLMAVLFVGEGKGAFGILLQSGE